MQSVPVLVLPGVKARLNLNPPVGDGCVSIRV
jgi:hypothetical protein